MVEAAVETLNADESQHEIGLNEGNGKERDIVSTYIYIFSVSMVHYRLSSSHNCFIASQDSIKEYEHVTCVRYVQLAEFPLSCTL